MVFGLLGGGSLDKVNNPVWSDFRKIWKIASGRQPQLLVQIFESYDVNGDKARE